MRLCPELPEAFFGILKSVLLVLHELIGNDKGFVVPLLNRLDQFLLTDLVDALTREFLGLLEYIPIELELGLLLKVEGTRYLAIDGHLEAQPGMVFDLIDLDALTRVHLEHATDEIGGNWTHCRRNRVIALYIDT